MKEAAGEANLTVVAIILIGVVVAVVTPIVNSMMKNTGARACCTEAGGIWKNGCKAATGSSDFDQTGYQTCCTEAGVEAKMAQN